MISKVFENLINSQIFNHLKDSMLVNLRSTILENYALVTQHYYASQKHCLLQRLLVYGRAELQLM